MRQRNGRKRGRPAVLEMAQTRLKGLSNCLEGRDYLEHRVTAGDLLMVIVLRIAQRSPSAGRLADT
jgi:hypothetical protein